MNNILVSDYQPTGWQTILVTGVKNFSGNRVLIEGSFFSNDVEAEFFVSKEFVKTNLIRVGRFILVRFRRVSFDGMMQSSVREITLA
jgi:hypothetical protein